MSLTALVLYNATPPQQTQTYQALCAAKVSGVALRPHSAQSTDLFLLLVAATGIIWQYVWSLFG